LIKKVVKDDYVILFDTKTGQEVLSGINGNPDPFVLDFPSMMDVGIMGHCKNNCEFCYQGAKPQANMTLENFKRLVDEAKDETMQFALGGRGDPNLHKNFREIIEYCRENNIVPNYTTSGNGLTDEQVEISKMCGAVAVSAYDREFTYDAIRKLMDAGIKTNIHFMFSKYSWHDIFNLLIGVDIWHGKVDLDRLNAVIFLLFKPQGRAVNLKWEPLQCYYNWFIQYLRMANGRVKFKLGMDSCLVNKVQQVDKLTAVEEVFMDTCEGGRMSMYVTPDMKLSPCSFGATNKWAYPLINSIKDVWDNGDAFQRFRGCLEKCPIQCPVTGN